ncbi:ATP-dependent zinc metalloprotease FtsH [Thiovibrio sp. JS02]
MRGAPRGLLYVCVLVLFLGCLGSFFWWLENRLPIISYNSFLASLDSGDVAAVHIRGSEIAITDSAGRRSAAFAPDVGALLPHMLEKHIQVTVEPDRSPLVINVLTITLPLIFIAILWLLHQKMNVAAEEESDFARKKAIVFAGGDRQVTFRDVAGIPEVKEELLEIVDFLQRPKKYSKLGATIPKGVLLAGPPGTGKTLLARAIAGEAGVPFFSISGSDFVEMFVGVGASRVRDLFKEAKKKTPCIIFIDEIDAVGGHRGGAGAVGGLEERAQTLNALLVEMDGFGQEDNIIVIAATNRPDILDAALLRPGRFDRRVTLLPPDVKGRTRILEVHTRKVTLAGDVNLEEIARTTPGFTGAQLANLVNEAALTAARLDKEHIETSDFEAAKDRILMGAERKGLVISEADRLSMAYHEAGHAILARILPNADPLLKISIIPRGRAMGHTQQMPLNDRHAYAREYLLCRLTILMGGRAAEEIALGQQTTGAEEDLLRASEIATNMVCRWGMSEVVGPLAYARGEEGFLGAQPGIVVYSEETASLIDLEVKKLVAGCYAEAAAVLRREEAALRDLAEALLLTETLDREEMEIILRCSRQKQLAKVAVQAGGAERAHCLPPEN